MNTHSNRLKIYYSTAVRGGDLSKVRRHIDILSRFGEVLTKHLGADNEKTIDAGHADDYSIYSMDDKLMQSCDVCIADVSQASLGVGFMIARAISHQKPVLCVYALPITNPTAKLSAMINGCPAVVKKTYTDAVSYSQAVVDFLYIRFGCLRFKPLRLFLAGPCGSGKSTVARKIQETYGLPHISTGDLVRAIQKDKSHKLNSVIDKYVSAGELVPSEVMKEIVLERLAKPDCEILGYTLDGYPPSTEDVQNLIEAKVHPAMIMSFECSDETAISRQCGRAERSTDNREMATKRQAIYRKTIPDFYNLSSFKCPVVQINAEQNPDEVWNSVDTIIQNLIQSPNHSYFLDPPMNLKTVKSSRIHFHIDAPNDKRLRKLVTEIVSWQPKLRSQIKLYPIKHLQLGPQVASCPAYKQMMNFHSITDASNEQFATSGCGDQLDPESILTVLNCAKNSGKQYMVEIEEYIWEGKRGNNNAIIAKEFQPLIHPKGIFDTYPENRVKDVPAYELHHGFDIPKSNGPYRDQLPIPLKSLVEMCTLEGFNNGGWFIFDHPTIWKYRTNEFSNDTATDCVKTLLYQAKILKAILTQFGLSTIEIDVSLEIVHAIWQF